jgi:hypothetical protein
VSRTRCRAPSAEAEHAAIAHCRRLIAACEGVDYVTQELAVAVLAYEKRHGEHPPATCASYTIEAELEAPTPRLRLLGARTRNGAVSAWRRPAARAILSACRLPNGTEGF